MPLAIRKRKRSRRLVLLVAVVAYLLVMTFGGCADRLLLYPSTQPIAAPNATAKRFGFNGGQLEIWTQRTVTLPRNGVAEPPRIYVLGFCGNASRAEDEIAVQTMNWRQADAEVWVVNFPGYGASSGPARLKSIPPAALLAYDQLAKVAAGKPIYVSGNSLGCTAALYVATNRSVAGMLLQNPPPLRRLIMQHYGWWNLWLLAAPIALQTPQELNTLRTAPLVKAPAVFVLSDHDEIIPPRYHQMVVDAYAGSKRIVVLHGAGHNDGPNNNAEYAEIQAAIAWLLGTPPAR